MKTFLFVILMALPLFAQDPNSVTIASGDSISSAVLINGNRVVGIEVAADFNGSTITILTSSSYSGTYKAIKDEDGNTVSTITCSAGDLIRFKPVDFYLIRKYIKIEHDTPTNSNQTDIIFTGSY